MSSKIKMLVAMLLMAGAAEAQNLRLGVPGFGGTGCPAGSASVTVSPDASSLSILFDQYVVEAGGMNQSFGRKNCNIAIPIQIPQGFSVSVIGLDYRGFVGLPAGGRATLNVDYFLSTGGRGVRSSKTFYGATAEDYLKTDDLQLTATVWSACGESLNLRANTTLHVQSNRRNEQAMATVDSVDAHAGIIYHFQWRRCR